MPVLKLQISTQVSVVNKILQGLKIFMSGMLTTLNKEELIALLAMRIFTFTPIEDMELAEHLATYLVETGLVTTATLLKDESRFSP